MYRMTPSFLGGGTTVAPLTRVLKLATDSRQARGNSGSLALISGSPRPSTGGGSAAAPMLDGHSLMRPGADGTRSVPDPISPLDRECWADREGSRRAAGVA